MDRASGPPAIAIPLWDVQSVVFTGSGLASGVRVRYTRIGLADGRVASLPEKTAPFPSETVWL